MIGVIPKPDQAGVVEEFFELFKTPWEFYRPERAYEVVIATTDEVPVVTAKVLVVYGPAVKDIDARLDIIPALRREGVTLNHGDDVIPIYGHLLTFAESSNGVACISAGSEIVGLEDLSSDPTVIRVGYDLFDEIRFLLSSGQPLEHAHIPTLDIHIRMMREWIVGAGIPLLEIPPAPADHSFLVCLTHDIDFVGIRQHLFDHSMLGFIYRATIGALRNTVRGRLSLTRLFRSWWAVASLPFVYAGWMRDFWEPFEWYLIVEKGIPATYFLIPFKRQSGQKVPGPHASRRATAYDITELPHWTAVLLNSGCAIGVHGIDAWHSKDKARAELEQIAAITGESSIGIRMHWLLRDANTPEVLEHAGYDYDSTFGYNDTVGYRAGTSQVFRPLGAGILLELPLHIQDGALFYPQKLDLSELEAGKRCKALIENAKSFGGVLTILWHDRSHGPERFWGQFYVRLVDALKSVDAWFGTATQVVNWFRKRRHVRFLRVDTPNGERTRICYDGDEIQPQLRIRVHCPPDWHNDIACGGKHSAEFIDISWNGKSADELEFEITSRVSALFPNTALCSFP